MSEKGLEPLANLRETLWLLARALRLRTSDWRIFCLKETTHTHIHSSFTTFRVPHAVLRYVGWQFFGVSCWLTWASERTRPLGRLFVLFFAGIRGQPAGRRPQLTIEVVHEDVPVNRTEHNLRSNNWFKHLWYLWKTISCVQVLFWYVQYFF